MNVLLARPTPFEPSEFTDDNMRPAGRYNDGTDDWYLYLTDKLRIDSGVVIIRQDGAKLIGAWENDGTITQYIPEGEEELQPVPIDPDYLSYIRPMGNVVARRYTPDGDLADELPGVASNTLDFQHYFGHAQRHMQDAPVADTLPIYAADNQPIVLTMERRQDETPGFEGPGWIATIEFSDPARPPDARAIGIYDADWNFSFTTGAFVWTDTGQLDAEGNPVFKWQTVNPAGRLVTFDEPIYYALLLGSAQEGRIVLPPDQMSLVRNFWEGNAVPPPPAGDTWLDSGQTVSGNAGTITLVSGDKTEFPLGALVRIEGNEGTVNSYWAGGEGLEILPTLQYTVGAPIEIWGTA